MVGGNNYRKSQFNLAVQGVRQPGSAFKPFVLATALRQGISPATHFDSEPQTINLGDKYWVVGNYEDAYLGSIDLETATIESDNAVYAQLTQLVGSKNVAETAQRPGHPEQARRLLRDRARRRGREPARARAGVRHVRLRRPPGRRRDVRQQAARDRAGDGARRPQALQHERAARRAQPRTRPGS